MLEFLLGTELDARQAIPGIAGGPNELIELEMNRLRIAVLGGLDKEDHQERDNSRSSIDDQLPGVTEVKRGTANGPYDDAQKRQAEADGTTYEGRTTGGEVAEGILLHTINLGLSFMAGRHDPLAGEQTGSMAGVPETPRMPSLRRQSHWREPWKPPSS
jgi:hypothetical protein